MSSSDADPILDGPPSAARDTPEGAVAPLLDISMKLLCQQSAASLLRLAGLEVDPGLLHLEESSILVRELRADNVLHIRNPIDPFTVIAEYQGRPDRESLHNWLIKKAILRRDLKQDVFLVVFYLFKGDRATFPDRLEAQRGDLIDRDQFTAVRVWECGEQIRGEGLEELTPLLVLCEEKPTEATIQEEVERLRKLPKEKQAGLMAVAYLLGTRFFLEEVLKTIFEQEELEMIKTIGPFREWIAEGEAKGRQEGEVKGRQEGRQEGQAEGRATEARHILLRLLRKRFGELPASLVRQIEAAEPEQCEDMAERALEYETIAEFLTRPS